jgi:hypothetical protein
MVKDIGNLDLEKDKVYIIHQILMYGDFSDIKHLFHIYSLEVIRSVFLSFPKRIYTKPIFALIKKFVLGFEKEKLDERNMSVLYFDFLGTKRKEVFVQLSSFSDIAILGGGTALCLIQNVTSECT